MPFHQIIRNAAMVISGGETVLDIRIGDGLIASLLKYHPRKRADRHRAQKRQGVYHLSGFALSDADILNVMDIAVEPKATHHAKTLAKIVGVPLMIVHLANGQSVDEIRRAKTPGATVFAETCPQRVTLTAGDLDLSSCEDAKHVCCLPPRSGDQGGARSRRFRTADGK